MLCSRDYRLTGSTYNALFDQLRASALLSMVVDRGVLTQHDLALGAIATFVGNPLVGYDGDMGMMIDFDGSGDRLSFANHPWAANSDATLACIFKLDAGNAFGGFVCTRGGNNVGLMLGQHGGTSGIVRFTKGGVSSTDSSITLSFGIPYFLAVGYRHADGAINFVARRLDTGEVTTDSKTETLAYSAGDGSFTVGGSTFGAVDSNCKMAAAYAGNRYFDSDALQQWARDPFGLWIYDDAWDPIPYSVAAPPPATTGNYRMLMGVGA